MTVSELADKLGFQRLLLPNGDRDVLGGYCGDLLSWVMGRAEQGSAWVTIMSNINVAAVAQLTDVACVIFAEGVQPDSNTLDKAAAHGINLLSSPLDSFTLCARISELLK